MMDEQRKRAGVDEEFFGRVGHDLRGELATILAGVHFVLRYEPELGERTRQMLGRVEGAGQRLRHLLDEFGDAAWAVANEPLQPATMPYELGGALKRAIETQRTRADTADVVIELDDLADAAIELVGDVGLIELSLGYALDFAMARSRGGRIRVGARALSMGAEISIADSGGLLPSDRLAKLGDPFIEKEAIPRNVNARERLGLGLAICRGILEAHGGSFHVGPSEDAEGIVLRCRLVTPRAAAKVA
jgi:K+-sensing histidine kinase KdpD